MKFRTKLLCVMKLTTAILLLTLFQVSAREAYSQTVSYSAKNVTVKEVFNEIKKQTGYTFFFNKADLTNTKPVSIDLKTATLETALKECLKNQPLIYTIEGKTIFISAKSQQSSIAGGNAILPPLDSLRNVHGKVVNEKGEPLVGVSVLLKGSKRGTMTDENGIFELKGLKDEAVLQFSGINIETEERKLNGRTELNITARIKVSELDEVIVNKGYYSTFQKLNTGSVSKITSEDIERQPISNPISALQGRVPGLLITQKNGLPGANLSIQIRGQNSIQQGNDPLFVVDGVPFSSENLVKSGSSLNANNPFTTINPADVESIEILKDADATAIYGSRGANGVILITTKKGKPGKISVNANLYAGLNKATRTMDFMSLSQYLEMRREAFKNDGVIPDISNAPDLFAWDTTRYTDWKKEIIGRDSYVTNTNVRLNAGSKNLNYSLNTGYYSEGSVLPGDQKYSRGSVSLSLSNLSANEKFSAQFSASYTFDKNHLASQDLTTFLNLAPNFYRPYDSLGQLQWSEGGVSYGNPFASLQQPSNSSSERLIANANLTYKISSKLKLRSNFNYNTVSYSEYSARPISSQNPAYNPSGDASFNNTTSKIWNIEPQVDYSTSVLGKGTIQFLVGGTWQQKNDDGTFLIGSGYTTDAQINSIGGASSIYVENDIALYKYSSLYSRINLNWDDKYLLNLVAREDASSRFGPANRLARFGALGFAWIFSKESIIRNHLSSLSTGKLRISIGTTGNDRIGDYKYLDTWINTYNSYQNQSGLRPIRIFNDNYGWEEIQKFNIGLDLGFIKDRIVFTADLFDHKSKNQLVAYSLPDQTGFNNVIKNIPGVIQNKGVELLLSTVNVKGKDFSWKSSFNLTIQRNKLLEFYELEKSNYANEYIIGKPLNLLIGYTYLGVDPQTGVYQFDDKNKDGLLNTQDYSYQGTTDPDFFGGFSNTFQFKNLELSFLFEFRKQVGRHAIFGYSNFAGLLNNQPIAALDRWQKPGDIAEYQRYTQDFGSQAADAGSRIQNSSAALTDASFIRLKNLSVSYSFPTKLIKRVGLQSLQLYFQSQNLFTITKYVGADPENQNLQVLPPLSVFATGININF